MPHVLLINPDNRPRRKVKPKRTRTMAEKRNAKGQFVSTKRKTRRRKNPESRSERSAAAKKGWRTRRRKNPESRSERSAAAKRGWAHRKHSHSHHRSHHARRRTYRRNPSASGIARAFEGALLPALLFGGGALANDVVHGFVPLPSSMKTGYMVPVSKLLTGAGLGVLAAMMLGRENARLAIGGMLGGVLYDTSKAFLASHFPTLSLSGLADYPPMTYESAGGVLSGSPMTEDGNLLGAYLPDTATGTGGGSVHGLGVYLSNEGE